MEYIGYFNEQCIKAADIALEHNLYVAPDWGMYNVWLDVQRQKLSVHAVIAFDDKKPIASALIVTPDNFAMAFVKVPYRCKGIGSQCITVLKPKIKDKAFAKIGVGISDIFWEKNNIPLNFFKTIEANGITL